MSRVDLHIHSKFSDGAGTINEILEAASRKRELVAIAITDHNEIVGALEAVKKSKKFGVTVIVGEEISSTGGHILGLFLKEKIDRDLTPEETVRQIHNQGGLAVIPHPYPHYKGLGLYEVGQLVQNPDQVVRPDAIEVRNGYPPQLIFANQLHRENLQSWNLPETGSSDSHHPRSLGSCWTEFDGNSVEDFVRALREGKTRPAGKGWGVLETARAQVADVRYKLRRRFKD